jgi:peroxiredoxin
MTIATGDSLPDSTLLTMTAEGPTRVSVKDFFAGKKVVLFAVPGAFTPTCHNTHLPGFIANASALKEKGADAIVCISVNDIFVLNAWAKQSGADEGITFLADGNGEFTRAIGMQIDASGFGMGERSKRYSMIVDNGRVLALHEEPAPGQAIETSAEKILSEL